MSVSCRSIRSNLSRITVWILNNFCALHKFAIFTKKTCSWILMRRKVQSLSISILETKISYIFYIKWYCMKFEAIYRINAMYIALVDKIGSHLWRRWHWNKFSVVYTIECDKFENCKMNRLILKGAWDLKVLHLFKKGIKLST